MYLGLSTILAYIVTITNKFTKQSKGKKFNQVYSKINLELD